ncbi:uncharacterized protein LOC143185449 [Calliopsis andreniformis]|uniref:uncharacterized protein LOC143185449 n=1 Tax=Calliopsis andreniformis TaxID=337506 RepID=UPI003FCE1335
MDYTQNGQFEISYFRMVWTIIASVGWYIVAIAVGFWYASPYIWGEYTKWKLKKDEQDYAAKYHKNLDLLQERLSGLEASRQRMQEEYRQKCIAARREGRKENKQTDSSGLVDVTGMGSGIENKTKDSSNITEKKSKSIRREYNPLIGDSSRGYRPPKRSCCGKGGCG